MFLSTLGAEFCPGQIFGTTGLTKDRFRLLFGRMAAAGAKLGIGCQVLAAVAALDENQLLVTAHGTELGRQRYRGLAFPAFSRFGCSRRGGGVG